MRRRSLALCLLGLVVLVACGAGDGGNASGTTTSSSPDDATARPAGNGVGLARVGSFDQPLYVTAPPGDKARIFVVEQPGRIFVVKNGKKASTPFLDVRSKVSCCGEQGLLSLAFAPDYAKTKKFYIDYTDKAGRDTAWEYRAS